MKSTHGSTPPNPNFDLPNHSTDLNKTLGIVGTPHEESIANFSSTRTCQIKGKQRNPAENLSIPRTPKNPKLSPLTYGFGRGIKDKRTKRGLRKSPPRTTGNNTTYLEEPR
jgi:hypothetical protein